MSFLAKPTATRQESRITGVVAGTDYQAHFTSTYGTGGEIAAVVQLVQRPSDTCKVVHALLHGTLRCPTADIRNRRMPPGTSRVTLFHEIGRCPAKLCNGYLGAVAILQAKMVYYVGLSGTDRPTVEQVLRSLSS